MSALSWRPTASVESLRTRAQCLARVRSFLAERKVLEVQVPSLQTGPNLDHGITPLQTQVLGKDAWLITSPEHFLKRFLCAGYSDCYSLAPVWRDGEVGRRHASEFWMLEWYRLGFSARQLALEVVDLCRQVTDRQFPTIERTWHQAFLDAVGVPADHPALPSHGMDCEHWSRAQHIDALWSTVVEASFPKESYTIIHDWPVESSAQARICADKNGCLVAARFEVYAGGLELANGYHELADAVELRERMETIRAESGQKCQDERFFAALAHGLPDVSGVALGFDRLVMLASGAEGISAVQAFGEG